MNGGDVAKEANETAHPRGLYALFFTEMWERFCYYGMRALLVLYLIQYHGWQPSQASTIYKWYTSLVYLTPLLGGLLADRLIGLRVSIVLGATLMATGEVLLTFEPLSLFYVGLALLILGNGFFKPNISTIVGKMYRHDDRRRDRAFTIFYMGINLGAGLSPLVCGHLRVHYGFRYGFAAAAVGMLLGLFIFLATQGQILRDVAAAGNDLRVAGRKQVGPESKGVPRPEEIQPGVSGAAGILSRVFPALLFVVAVVLPLEYLWQALQGRERWPNVVMPVAFGAIAGWMGTTLYSLRGAARDKSVVIFVLFLFSVLFWMAFEQAGNALNLWAQFHTDLHVGPFAYPAEWWQSVNAALIVLLAPLFARLWTWLGAHGREPSTPTKMLWAMVLMTISFAVMVAGARIENRTVTREPLAAIPSEVPTTEIGGGRVAVGEGDAGRLTFDSTTRELEARGVLPRYVVNALLERTVPSEFKNEIESLEAQTRQANGDTPARVTLSFAPGGYALPFSAAEAEERGITWDPPTRTMTFTKWVDTPTRTELVAAGAPSGWRQPLLGLENKSNVARVSGVWLLLSYLFATLGELCLSPVGLSMVTKLAPLRFASLFMGVWLLSSSVAQYAGGSIGETWGIVPPPRYFMLFVWTSIVGVVFLSALVRPLRRLMHEVH